MATRPPNDTEDPALSLVMAVIMSSPTPLLLLDGELRVAGASLSFCETFGVDIATASGHHVFELGTGEWDVTQLRALLTAIAGGTAQIVAFEMELKRPDCETRCVIINARRLVYQDLGQPWLLVAVADVTDARASERAKNEIIDQLGVLLREVRHRVANSLQIVSAVLLQNARRTTSPETRDYLRDAHHRVMAVAQLERQLSESQTGDEGVELRAYFTNLCNNIAASLIGEEKAVTLVVTGGGLVTSRVSVSLGLIVTELVINALKHAFPNGGAGRIEIGYNSHGPNWTLSVRDDGIGLPNDPVTSRTGLGTGIVQALAKQLQATVETAPAVPGTVVRVEHVRVALVGENEDRNSSATLSEGPRSGPTRDEPGRSNANEHVARR